MADRSLKGTGLGAKSFEDETGVEFEPRRDIEFACAHNHLFTVAFAQDADMPTGWACPRCGRDALRTDGQRHTAKEEKRGRTHWDMLRERRSVPDLERLLAERIALLHTGRIGPTASDPHPFQQGVPMPAAKASRRSQRRLSTTGDPT